MSEELLAALKKVEDALDQAKADLSEAIEEVSNTNHDNAWYQVFYAVDGAQNQVEIVLEEMKLAHDIAQKIRDNGRQRRKSQSS